MLRTGTAFALFGIACLFTAFIGLPLAGAMDRRGRADLRAQRILSRGYRWFERVMTGLGLIAVERIGDEHLRGDGPQLVVANHPTLIDVVLLLGRMPQADCIVNSQYAGSVFLQRLIGQADYIPNDRGSFVVEEGARRLSAGRRLLIFPEGGRSPSAGLGHFYRGAAHIALAGGWDLLPVTITCEPRTLMKGQKWYDVPARKARYVIRVDAPISSKEYLDEKKSIAARRLTARLREHYEARLHCGQG